MKKNDVVIGAVYFVKVSGHLSRVRVKSESQYGGWNGENLDTGRMVRIRTAARLRRPVNAKPAEERNYDLVDSGDGRKLAIYY